MKSIKLLAIFVVALLPVACSYNPNDYSCFTDIDPNQGWNYGTTFVYMPQTADSIAQGALTLLVRHNNDYAYSNLWITLESQQPQPDGHVETHVDTFCIELADIYGNWYGSGRGLSFAKVDTLYTDFLLTNGAPLRLRHIMRPDNVTGIEQVGLIFKANSNE